MASLPSSSTAFTHLLALLAGVAIGKSMDATELNAYRSSADEGVLTKIRRKMREILIGGVVLGLLYKTGRMAIGSGGVDDSRGGGGSGSNAE